MTIKHPSIGVVTFLLILVWFAAPAAAQFPKEVNGLFYWGGGFAVLENNRANELFTDNFERTGRNDGTDGWFLNAGWDLPIWGLPWGHVLLSELNLEFKRFGSGPVNETFFALDEAGTPTVVITDRRGKVRITELSTSFSPKYRFDSVTESRRFRPWIIPFGLDISAVGPFTSSIEHLEVGLTFGVGADFKVTEKFIIGVQARYDVGFGQVGIDTNDFIAGGYIGIGY